MRLPRKLHRITAITALVGIVATGSGATTTLATEDVDRAAALASIVWPNVREVDGTPLARVDIRDVAGKPMNDAVIVASLWPTPEARGKMKAGDTWNLVPIDRTDVTAGAATIHANDPDLLKAYTSAEGTVKVHLDVYAADGSTTVLMVQRFKDGDRWINAARKSTVGVDGTAPVEFVVDPKQFAKIPFSRQQTEAPLETRNHQGATCSAMEYAGLYNAYETVATTAVYKGIKANVTYSSAANTTSGLGAQLGGGAWQLNGEMTRSSTLNAAFVTVTGSSTAWTNKEFRATWAHHRDYRHCVDPYDVTYPYNDTWITQRFTEPYKVVGFPAIINSRYALPGCHTKQSLQGVSNIDTEDATASKYIVGFKITWGVGTFNGTAQSGYSTAVKVKFTNPTAGTYWYWCGDTFAPQDSPRIRAGR